MSEELKPCPFCGEKLRLQNNYYSGPLWKRINNSFRVECPKCNASTYEFTTAEQAIEAWNRRANE